MPRFWTRSCAPVPALMSPNSWCVSVRAKRPTAAAPRRHQGEGLRVLSKTRCFFLHFTFGGHILTCHYHRR